MTAPVPKRPGRTKKVVVPSVCDTVGKVSEAERAFTPMQRQQLKTVIREALEGIIPVTAEPAAPLLVTPEEKREAMKQAGWHPCNGVHLPGFYWRSNIGVAYYRLKLVEMAIVHTGRSVDSKRVFRFVMQTSKQYQPVTHFDIHPTEWNNAFDEEDPDVFYKPYEPPLRLLPPGLTFETNEVNDDC